MYDRGEVPTKELLQATAKELLQAMQQGYGNSMIAVDYNSPDFNTLDKLTNNVYQFSAAKNYQELRDMTLALRDGERIRSFSEFKQAVGDIDDKYQRWLHTEYNQAIISSQQAARWIDFVANKKDMPMLRYQTIGDMNVRPEHQAFDGITRKVDDGFWNTHYPPNGWGCRCEAIQLTNAKAPETELIKKHLPGVPSMWSFNVGKSGMIFPEKHPYYNGIPEDVRKQADKAMNSHYNRIVRDWINENIVEESINLPEFQNEVKLSKESYKSVLHHLNHKDKFLVKDLKDIVQIAKKEEYDVPLQEKANKEQKEKSGITHFNYYSFKMKGKEWWLNNAAHEDGYEKPYAIIAKKQKSQE